MYSLLTKHARFQYTVCSTVQWLHQIMSKIPRVFTLFAWCFCSLLPSSQLNAILTGFHSSLESIVNLKSFAFNHSKKALQCQFPPPYSFYFNVWSVARPSNKPKCWKIILVVKFKTKNRPPFFRFYFPLRAGPQTFL